MKRSSFYISVFSSLLATGCFDLAGTCETEVTGRYLNPSGNIQAVCDVTDCGATTSPSYGVRIIESTDTADAGSRENTILGSRTSVSLHWISNDSLIIYGADTTTGYTRKNEYPLSKNHGIVFIVYKDRTDAPKPD